MLSEFYEAVQFVRVAGHLLTLSDPIKKLCCSLELLDIY
jgi:hypothetical protein